MLRALTIGLVLAAPVLAWAQTSTPRPANPAPAQPSASNIDAQPLLAGSERLVSSADERIGLAITLTADGPAHFTDQRELALLSGRNSVAFADLPTTLLPATLYWQTATLPELRALSATPTVVNRQAAPWQAELFVESGGNRTATLNYRASGLNWQSSYELRLINGSDQAQWREALVINNQTGIDLSGAQFTATNALGQTHRIGEIHSLRPGTRWRGMRGEAQSLTLTQQLVAQASANGPQPDRQQVPVQQRVLINAEQAAVIGFSAGPVAVMSERSGVASPMGQTQWQPQQRSGAIELDAGLSTAVEVERLQVDYRHLADGIENAWQIKLHNPTDSEQTIRLEEHIEGAWQIEAGEADWQRTATGLQRRISLAAGERREVGYRIRQLTP